MSVSALPVLLASLLAFAPPADDFAITELAPGVTLLSGGPDGNVLVVDAAGERLVVDGQTPARAERLLEQLDALPGALGRPLRWVVDTHFHEDHRGLNALLAARGAVVVAHAETRALMLRHEFVEELAWELPAAPAAALPTLLARGDLVLHLGHAAAGSGDSGDSGDSGGARGARGASDGFTPREVRLLHLPAAHTGGDLAVHLPDADVIHAGDVFELGAWPFLDAWHGGTLAGLVAAADRLLAVAGEHSIIVPGHGPPSDRATLAAYRDVLAGLLAKRDAAIAQGQDLQAFVDGRPTAEWDERWGGERGGRRLAAIAALEGAGQLAEPRPLVPGADG